MRSKTCALSGANGVRWSILLGILPLSSGCVQKINDQGTMVYSLERWVVLAALSAAIVAIPFGWAIRQRPGRAGHVGWILLVGGPLALITVVPGLWTQFVKLDQQHFELRTGFWFAPTLHDIEFANTKTMTLASETSRGRRGRQTTKYFLICESSSGDRQKVPVGDLMKEALADILVRAGENNVMIYDQAGSQ